MSKLAVTPLSLKYHRMMGVTAFWEIPGDIKLRRIGPVGSVTLALSPTEVEARSSEGGGNDLIATYITARDATVTFTDCQMWTPWMYAAVYMSEIKYATQTALTSGVLEIPTPEAGDVILVPGIRPSVTSVSDGAESDPVTYASGDDYTFDQPTALLEILKVPEDAALSIAKVTYSLPAITEEDGILDMSIMSTSGMRGKLHLKGRIDGGPGTEVTVVVPDVEFRPNGDIALGDTQALNVSTIVGKVYNTSPKGLAYLTSHASIK